MPITNVPGGLTSFGIPVLPPSIPPTCGVTWWVGNRTDLNSGDGSDPTKPFSTLAAALLAASVANRGDNIVILPGHAETIVGTDILANLTKGTSIIGLGQGSNRPTFTFTGATDQLLFSTSVTSRVAQGNNLIQNCIFQNPAAANVTLAIDVAAAEIMFYACSFFVSDIAAAQKITSLCRLSSGGNRFKMINCEILGGATTAVTDTVLVNAAVDSCEFIGNTMIAQLATTEGLITCATAAATNMQIIHNYFFNSVASSTVALKGMTAVTGWVNENFLGVALGTVVNANGTSIPDASLSTPINTPGNWFLGRNNYAAKPGLYGLVCGSVTS